jgi:hypothetical protein
MITTTVDSVRKHQGSVSLDMVSSMYALSIPNPAKEIPILLGTTAVKPMPKNGSDFGVGSIY